MQRLVIVWVVLSLAAGTLRAQQKPGRFTAKDWSELHSAHPAAVSVKGEILYSVSYGGEKGPTRTEWWMTDANAGHAKKLDVPDGFHPAGFTRDGESIYGGWKVNDRQQFAIFAFENGKLAAAPRTVVVLPRGIESAIPSPDGKLFAITADPRDPDPMDAIRHVQEPEEASLYVVKADGTEGAWWCADLRHISGTETVGGGGSSEAWSADSQSLAVLSQAPRIGHHEIGSMIDVCNASSRRHVTDIANSVSNIAWANAGRDLAFLSTKSLVLTPEHVWTVPVSGGPAEDRTPDLEGTAVQLAGDAKGRLWVVLDRGVQNEVDEFRDGVLKTAFRWADGIVGPPVESDYADTDAPMVTTVADPTHTSNLALVEGGHLHKITHEGDDQMKTFVLGPLEKVDWKTKEGIRLEGILTFPPGYEKGTKYPFLVLPHGGPEANDELGFDPLVRIIAGMGYVVLQPEYRGSTGYGADFLAAIYQHFGDRAYQDVDSATDFAVSQGWADPNRLAIFGWSAGGFMTSWTVTQTHRYKVAIEGAGITDWGPFLWTSDISQVDYDARWTDEDPEAFRKFSAVAFAKNVTTPLLILHGEADQRVPTFQGTEYFQILAARGKTVRMVTYPGSPHFPLLWEQRLNVVEELESWLKKYNP